MHIQNIGKSMLHGLVASYNYVPTYLPNLPYMQLHMDGMQEAFILLKSFQCCINQFMELHWLVLITKCLSTIFTSIILLFHLMDAVGLPNEVCQNTCACFSFFFVDKQYFLVNTFSNMLYLCVGMYVYVNNVYNHLLVFFYAFSCYH